MHISSNDETRTTYRELRAMAMESAYRHCQSIIYAVRQGHVKPTTEIALFGRFFDETYECFDDIEELMYRTLELILDHGNGPEVAREWCNRIINEILTRKSFDELSKDMSEEESKELRNDLKLLKFID